MSRSSAIAALSLMILSACAGADQIVLNPVADVRILNIFLDTNDNQDGLATYNDGTNIQRSLIQFDYSSLAGATITSATLRLQGASYLGSTASTSMDLYRVTGAWGETTATWDSRDTGLPWTNQGGDAVGTTGAQLSNPYYHWTGNQTAAPSWYEFDATSLVQASVTGGDENDGMLVVGDVGNQLVFVSREGYNFAGIAGSSADIPQLVVDFTPAPEPISGIVLGTAVVGLLRRRFRRRARENGFQG